MWQEARKVLKKARDAAARSQRCRKIMGMAGSNGVAAVSSCQRGKKDDHSSQTCSISLTVYY
jgi:hypothetical protein